jgi:hypothetical protein
MSRRSSDPVAPGVRGLAQAGPRRCSRHDTSDTVGAMRALCVVLFLVGCGPSADPRVELISPTEGATVTTDDVVFTLMGYDLEGAYDTVLTVDQVLVPRSQFSTNGPPTSGCASCSFSITWSAAGVENGSHVIRIDLEYDLAGVPGDSTVTLNFAR